MAPASIPRLIHIGLPKTATTSLQNIWRNDPGIALVYQGLMQVVTGARRIGLKHPVEQIGPVGWQYDTKPVPGQHIVFSQEALCTAYINERAPKDQHRRFQMAAALLTHQIAPGTKILITVRSPKGWIASIYNQAIKQGGTDTFPQFLEKEKDYIHQCLNIKELHEIWAGSYGSDNVLVLPMELFLQDKDEFFQSIHEMTGLPVPNLNIEQNANPSMTREHLKLMRAFNEWCEIFSAHGIYQPQLPANIQQALNIIRFAVRYNLESPPPELARRVTDVENRLPDCELDPSRITKELLDPINTGFRQLLGEDDFFGYRALYTDP